MDHSKIGLTDFVKVGSIETVDTIVTEPRDGVLGEWLETIGVKLIGSAAT